MKIFRLLFIPLFLFACAQDINDDAYQLSSAGTPNQVGQGVIIDVRPVQIQGTTQGGSLIGGLAGGVAGSTIGQGAGSVLASVGGALAGAFIGGVTEKELSQQKALQYLVRLADGSVITVIQGTKNKLSAGQKVFVLYGRETRLIPDNIPSP